MNRTIPVPPPKSRKGKIAFISMNCGAKVTAYNDLTAFTNHYRNWSHEYWQKHCLYCGEVESFDFDNANQRYTLYQIECERFRNSTYLIIER